MLKEGFVGVWAMPKMALEHWIITQNIERFDKLVAQAPDSAERARLQRLLDDERAKLGSPVPDREK